MTAKQQKWWKISGRQGGQVMGAGKEAAIQSRQKKRDNYGCGVKRRERVAAKETIEYRFQSRLLSARQVQDRFI